MGGAFDRCLTCFCVDTRLARSYHTFIRHRTCCWLVHAFAFGSVTVHHTFIGHHTCAVVRDGVDGVCVCLLAGLSVLFLPCLFPLSCFLFPLSQPSHLSCVEWREAPPASAQTHQIAVQERVGKGLSAFFRKKFFFLFFSFFFFFSVYFRAQTFFC